MQYTMEYGNAVTQGTAHSEHDPSSADAVRLLHILPEIVTML
jgi:hypothetical protein